MHRFASLRVGENIDKVWFRSDRFFTVASQYYFSTREKIDVGPFPNHLAAERGLALYIQYVEEKNACPQYASKVALQGMWASAMHH